MTSDVYELTISAPGRNAISSVLMERMMADPWTTVARVVVPITRATSEMYADTDRNLPTRRSGWRPRARRLMPRTEGRSASAP